MNKPKQRNYRKRKLEDEVDQEGDDEVQQSVRFALVIFLFFSFSFDESFSSLSSFTTEPLLRRPKLSRN